jgi:hypothetical protein
MIIFHVIYMKIIKETLKFNVKEKSTQKIRFFIDLSLNISLDILF